MGERRRTWLVAAVALAWVAGSGCDGTGGGADEQTTLGLTLPDEDGDTIMDHHEGTEEDDWYDFDGDATPNFQDTDSDEDGIPDSVEAGDDDLITFPFDSDNDGLADFVDLDADNNCLEDAIEGAGDQDSDGSLDFGDVDDDGDNILDAIEIGAACAFPDTDGDGTPDYHDADSDDDGIADIYEGGVTPFNPNPVDTDGDGTADYLDLDSDEDGMLDAEERGDNQIFEAPRDTDGDGIGDYADADSDNDGLGDATEVAAHTDPYDEDSDHDGYTDGAEVSVGTDPLDPGSVIEGIYVEVPPRTDVDEAFVFDLTVEKGDVAFVIDTTGSMQGTINAITNEFAQIVGDLAASIPDAEYGVATFDDYNAVGMGTGADRPFILLQQVTDDTNAVQTKLAAINLHNGGDTKESSTEAITQAMGGTGYDQNCNGTFDNNDDVLPFRASAADPFGGSAGESYVASTSGGGTIGGMGFRDYALPIVIYATDAPMRNSATDDTPGGCPLDASGTDAANAAAAIGARLIGIVVNTNNTAKGQMEAIALATGSLGDLDGDGVASEPLVFDWSGSNAQFRQTIVDAVDNLIGAVVFQEITLQIEGDDEGFVIGIDPAVYYPTGAINGEVIDFTLTFRGTSAPSAEDELHQLTLNVIGDGTVLLDTLDVYVLVPGTTL